MLSTSWSLNVLDRKKAVLWLMSQSEYLKNKSLADQEMFLPTNSCYSSYSLSPKDTSFFSFIAVNNWTVLFFTCLKKQEKMLASRRLVNRCSLQGLHMKLEVWRGCIRIRATSNQTIICHAQCWWRCIRSSLHQMPFQSQWIKLYFRIPNLTKANSNSSFFFSIIPSIYFDVNHLLLTYLNIFQDTFDIFLNCWSALLTTGLLKSV